VRIDPETGLLAAPGQSNALFEYFKEEDVPSQPVKLSLPDNNDGSSNTDLVPEQLF